MSESVQREPWDSVNAVNVPTEEEFEALETRVDNINKSLAQVAATLLDLASEVSRLRDKLEGPQ